MRQAPPDVTTAAAAAIDSLAPGEPVDLANGASGAGVPSAPRIVERHGGRVGIEPSPRAWATFPITLGEGGEAGAG